MNEQCTADKHLSIHAPSELSVKLMEAVTKGDFPLVKNLVSQGADVNAVDSFYGTALICAVIRAPLEFVKYIVNECNADLYLEDTNVKQF